MHNQNSTNDPKGVTELVADVRRSRENVLTMVRDMTDHDGKWKPSGDEWSAAEIIEHLVLAEMIGVQRIWHAMVFSDRPPDTSSNRGQSIEKIVERTWRPREKAPPDATPRGDAPLAFWAASLESCQTVLEALAPRLADHTLEQIVFPHLLSGPLDARQRLEFLRFHLDRHADQLARLAAKRS